MPPPIRRTITLMRAESTLSSSTPLETVASSSSQACGKMEPAGSRKTGRSLEPAPHSPTPVQTVATSSSQACEKVEPAGPRETEPSPEPPSSQSVSVNAAGAANTEQSKRIVPSMFGKASLSGSTLRRRLKPSPHNETRGSRVSPTGIKPSRWETSSARTAAPSIPESIYGVVPRAARSTDADSSGLGSSSESAAKHTPFTTTWESVQPTRPVVHSISHNEEVGLPDPPVWLVYLVCGCMAAGFMSAILLYLVNFPTSRCWLRESSKTEKYEYYELKDLDSGPDREKDLRRAKTPTTGFSTAARSPTRNTVRHRPRKAGPESMSGGLGISLPEQAGSVPSFRRHKSFDEGAAFKLYKPLPDLPDSPAASGWRSISDPTPGVKFMLSPLLERRSEHDILYELRDREPDVESGLLKPSTSPSRSASPSSSSSSISSRSSSSSRLSGSGFLTKIGDGVEYAADKFAKLLDYQIRGDAEEGLFLPVRDYERPKRMGNGKLKKAR
ncbi:Hypothetical predicted protein [Lecanosticta acicola]|uniref:Uncharacterized protein n=1 Tax=Lecanosticta acicola TaxID=111012 RepID=A0AAI8YSQ7_9PEZI|nr:Hypothetical predicted protein [Lecanosticta acicola]